MRFEKIFVALLLAVTVASSCARASKEVADLTRQRDEAREELKQTQNNYIRQNKELSAIMEELNVLSGRTNTLQLNYESCQDPLSQAEVISGDIESLKSKLDKLESTLERSKSELASAKKVIGNLKQMISRQEAEIASLKDTIKEYQATLESQDEKIRQQKSTIDNQQSTIDNQRSEISKKNEQLAERLFKAGIELESLADDSGNILSLRGYRNRSKGKQYRISIYEKAAFFYNLAAGEGHPGSIERAQAVEKKIAELK